MTVPDRSNSLAVLAGRIWTHHEAVTAAVKSSLESAVAAGLLLLEARELLPHGAWLPFLEQCGIPRRTASHYVRLADARDQIGNMLPIWTVNEALAALAPVAPPPHWFETFVSELELIHPGIKISVSPPGMSLPDGLTKEQFIAVGRLLRSLPGLPAELLA